MKVIISGVAGFIGTHTAAAFLARGATVVGCDNLSRRGNQENLAWLRAQSGNFQFAPADVRSAQEMSQLFASHRDTDAVIHLAGQVAVTTSVANPRLDFEANALGTFNILEAVRQHCPEAAFLLASTNKVYGGMEDVFIVERDGRYVYRDLPQGVSEDRPLDFHSPYGCSKGAADQYVRDYARIYGLRTIVARQSCIYGTRQFGIEDQGWVAWFTIASVLNKPITLYGDGKQIRDLLWIDDLVNFYTRAIEQIDITAGQVYNVGGGAGNTLSLQELLSLLGDLNGRKIVYDTADWRPGDQRVFVADVAKAGREIGWQPRISPQQGVERLFEWTNASKQMLSSVLENVGK